MKLNESTGINDYNETMTTDFNVNDPDYKRKVIDSFNRQDIMNTINASIDAVSPGRVEISFPYQQSLTQQHDFIHGGIISTVLDSACGYSAFSLMPVDAGVLTIEFKVNLLSPAKGDSFKAIGVVKKPGKTITVAEGDMYAYSGDSKKLIATMVGTLMTMNDPKGTIKG